MPCAKKRTAKVALETGIMSIMRTTVGHCMVCVVFRLKKKTKPLALQAPSAL